MKFEKGDVVYAADDIENVDLSTVEVMTGDHPPGRLFARKGEALIVCEDQDKPLAGENPSLTVKLREDESAECFCVHLKDIATNPLP